MTILSLSLSLSLSLFLSVCLSVRPSVRPSRPISLSLCVSCPSRCSLHKRSETFVVCLLYTGRSMFCAHAVSNSKLSIGCVFLPNHEATLHTNSLIATQLSSPRIGNVASRGVQSMRFAVCRALCLNSCCLSIQKLQDTQAAVCTVKQTMHKKLPARFHTTWGTCIAHLRMIRALLFSASFFLVQMLLTHRQEINLKTIRELSIGRRALYHRIHAARIKWAFRISIRAQTSSWVCSRFLYWRSQVTTGTSQVKINDVVPTFWLDEVKMFLLATAFCSKENLGRTVLCAY